MAVPRKLVVVPNSVTSATRELWRLAESGETDELAAVLPKADINARNEHGMTALMRAASQGHLQVVQVLLEHGADANIKRTDNFTALSLAAFFGHTEIVEILMRHGANPDVATRFGTSPQMWAKARSYGDVARCLEKRREIKKSVPTVAPPPSVVPSPAPTQVVRTLKDPPEIWDLVHEAPKNFDARSAFMARIGSMKGRFVISVAGLIVVGLIIGAMWLFKAVESPATVPGAAASVSVAPTVSAVPQTPANQSPEASNVVAEPAVVVSEPANTTVTTSVSRRPRRPATAPAIPNDFAPTPESAEVSVAPPVVAPRPTESGATSAGEPKKSASPPASSPVISPPKSSPPKAKVIQWP